VGEFVEIAGPSGGDLTGWTLVAYNGSGGAAYGTVALTGTLSSDPGQGYSVVDIVGLQNGAPDGLALVDPNGTVTEFLSYEGTLTATSGPAAGMTSVDIGVAETNSDALGLSLQRQADGTWIGPVAQTPGAATVDIAPPPPPTETTLISTIQGDGFASALVGQVVQVSAVVTMIAANGFYLQEEDADADGNAATSEGIFVFTGDTPNVEVSYAVSVIGTVAEFNGSTQLSDATFDIIGPLANLPTAADISLPFGDDATLEAVEGMRVSLDIGTSDAPLQVIETFELGRYGEIVVSEGSQFQPTQIYDAQTQAEEIAALQQGNAANRLTIDDGVSGQNQTGFAYIPNVTDGDNGNGYLDIGDDLSAGGTLRIGAEITAPVTGVMTYAFGEYKLVADSVLQIDEATNTLARDPAPEDVGGTLKVASVNTLNYFTTLNERGATTEADFLRQTDKLVTAVTALDADIIGLQEIENNGFGDGSAIATLVDALNARAGGDVYAFVDPTGAGSTIGTDAITTGLIYRVDAVTVLDSGILDYTPEGAQQQNRPTVAAAFEDANGEVVTIAVNHFKSKGGSGSGGDADIGDGQGNFNETRTAAAEKLTAWLASDPFDLGDPDYLIIGDLNAYGKEDPVQAIEAAGYTSLLDKLIGEDAFSYTFDGQRGALDQALASGTLVGQVTGITEWHINSLEPSLLGYSSQFDDPGWFNGSDPYSASDHDPLLIGLQLSTYADVEMA
ncbi:MAG: ExeM/NucH family extracellular endonuclease, partial [Alphaproteobacteria bacterium]|nr:ExeM/NucH family extracellular endonuclease [Alphaproteobacteria bacterium]